MKSNTGGNIMKEIKFTTNYEPVLSFAEEDFKT